MSLLNSHCLTLFVGIAIGIVMGIMIGTANNIKKDVK